MPGLWSFSDALEYLKDYPPRLRDQALQALNVFSQTRQPAALIGAVNPLGPLINDASQQAGHLAAPVVNAPLLAASDAAESLGFPPFANDGVTGEQLAPLLALGMGGGRGALPKFSGRNPMGFYSPVEKAMTTAPGKGQGNQYLAHLQREPGALKEAKESGLISALEQAPGTLTREEVMSMWNPLELTETVKTGHSDNVPIGGLSVGGVDFYRDGMPVDYSPYLLAKQAGLDKPTSAEHARAALIEDVLIDEWKLREGWEERGEQGVVDVVRQKISERIASGEKQLKYYPDDALREQILELRDIQNRIPDLYEVQMDEISRHPTRYAEREELSLPGGEEPKEILVKLPEIPRYIRKYVIKPPDGSPNYPAAVQTLEGAQEEASRIGGQIVQVIDSRTRLPNYYGSHWDEPNVLAHIRTNKRDVGGVRSLHIEEIQSDWHQEGQKRGYQEDKMPPITPEIKSKIDRFTDWEDALTDAYYDDDSFSPPEEFLALQRELRPWLNAPRRATPRSVPDAPYKKNWHELAFKRALMEAIDDPNVDRLTWTSGNVQADRYNLAKYIDSIDSALQKDGRFSLGVKYKEGNVENLTNIEPENLADYVGKEMAEKIVADKSGRYSGLDLKIGGEFHKTLYDQKIPQFAKKFLKKYGVEPQRISEFEEEYRDAYGFLHEYEIIPDNGSGVVEAPHDIWHGDEFIKSFPTRKAAEDYLNNMQNLWYIDITPKMRQELQKTGVPLAMNETKPLLAYA